MVRCPRGRSAGISPAYSANRASHFNTAASASPNGKTVFEYRYRVPQDASHFEIKAASAWHPVAYEGDFQIDPQSLELERLTIRTTELPPVAAFCQAATTLDYQRVHIGDSDVLLPRQSQLEILLKNGKEARNVTTFANCREYQAESEISFDSPVDAETAAARSTGRGRVALPIGLPVTLALAEPIDTATAAAGDPIDAKVVKPVRRAGSTEELIPAGAIVHGRIRRVEHHLLPTPYILVAMSFNRVDVQGVVSPFVARSEADAALARKAGREPGDPRNRNLVLGCRDVPLPHQQEPHRDTRRVRSEVVHTGHRQPMTRMAMH